MLAQRAVIALSVWACAGPLQPLPYQALEKLKPGVATMADAEAALGCPEDTAALPSGEQQWIYYFAPAPVVAAPELPAPVDAHRQSDVLLLFFSPAGVLLRHEAGRSGLGVRDSAHPSAPEHEALMDIPLK
jgi:hypothetical protein